MAVAVPRIAFQPGAVLTGPLQQLPSTLHGCGKELIRLPVEARENGLAGFLGALSLAGQIHDHRPHD